MKVRTTKDSIRIEVRLPVSLPVAWDLLTGKEHMAEWWGDHVTLEAKPGGTFLERWSDGTRQVVTAGVVARCQAPTLLEMTWADDDWPGDTRVAFQLSTSGDATRVVLEHSGWRVHPDAERQSLMEAHTAGWAQHMEALTDYTTNRFDSQ